MGAVAEAVGDVFGDVAQAVFEPIKQVGNIVESAVREVGHAVESVGREIGKVGQAAINDPVGTIAKVAAVASGQWWALPLVSAGLVIAHGGDIGQAALAGGIALASAGAAYGIGEALGAGSSAALDMASQDAANLASQGLTAGQISDILAQSYPQIGTSALTQVSGMATLGVDATQIASDVGAQMAAQNLAAATAANAAGAGTRTALSGGDLSAILSSAGTAGLGTGVGGATSLGLGEAGVGSTVAGAIGKGVGAATASAAAGKDGTAAFLNSLINTSLSQTGAQVKSMLKSAWNDVTASVNEYNAQLDKTNETQAKIAPLEKEAKDAEAAVNAELAAYQPVRDKFSDLVKQYDAAKAAGDVALANSLADQANAMIPELNAATEKYNNTYANYESKLNNYTTAIDGYKAEIAKTDELKAGYEKTSEQLTAEAKKLSDAAAKVVTLSEPVQNAFAKMYQTGTDVDTALENSNKLNGMSTIAQETFNRDIATSNNTNSAFEFASKVNDLDTKQQSAFQTGIKNGLDNTTAFEVAPIISNFNTNQQQTYTTAIKEGYGKEGADLISAFAAFASLAPEQNASVTVSAAPEKLDIATEFSKLDPVEQAKFKELVNDPTNPMTASDALKAVSDFFISPAAAGTLPFVGKTPDGKDLVESVYRRDPETGKWGEYIPDGKGGYTNTGAVLVGDYSAGPTGDKYIIDKTADQNGAPSLSMTPYVGDVKTTPTAPGSVVSTKEQLDKELADNQITKEEYDAAIKNVAPTATTGTTGLSTSNLTTPEANFTGTTTGSTSSGSTSTGSSGALGTPTGTATNTTGAGTNAGTGTGAVAGTGTGAATGGTGTGGGGTGGSGAGGTGTGTGGGGIGLGLGLGAAGIGTGYGGWQALQSQDQYGGIKNLTPGLTERVDYTLSGLPVDSNQDTVNPMSDIREMATGGTTSTNSYDPFSTKDVSGSGLSGSLTPGLSKAQIQYILTGLPGSNISVQGHAEGGEIEGHNPQFFSEGGLGTIENRYVQGEGDGTSDSVAAMLANGEFVIPADVVSKIGNGSNEAGASVLDQFLAEIRKHANSNGVKLPPESKGPLAYLLDAKRKVKA